MASKRDMSEYGWERDEETRSGERGSGEKRRGVLKSSPKVSCQEEMRSFNKEVGSVPLEFISWSWCLKEKKIKEALSHLASSLPPLLSSISHPLALALSPLPSCLSGKRSIPEGAES